jgi:chitodextrinase
MPIVLHNGPRVSSLLPDSVVNRPPTARFTISNENPVEGQTIEFEATGSEDPDGTIERYEWDLTGDGEFGFTGRTVDAAFSPGEYDITFRVTDDSGATATTTRTISVGRNAPPEAEADYEPVSPTTEDSITLDASGSTDPTDSIVQYEWDLDDDGTYEESGEVTTHRFNKSGEYTVTLRVMDVGSETDITTIEIMVENPAAEAESGQDGQADAADDGDGDAAVTTTGSGNGFGALMGLVVTIVTLLVVSRRRR